MLLVFISKLVEKALHSINKIITPTYSDHNVISLSTSRYENKNLLHLSPLLSLTVNWDVDLRLQPLVGGVDRWAAVLSGVLLAQLLDEEGCGCLPRLLLGVDPGGENSFKSLETLGLALYETFLNRIFCFHQDWRLSADWNILLDQGSYFL